METQVGRDVIVAHKVVQTFHTEKVGPMKLVVNTDQQEQ